MAAVFKFKADGSQYARGLNQMRGQTQYCRLQKPT
jgi:hypothetical protein